MFLPHVYLAPFRGDLNGISLTPLAMEIYQVPKLLWEVVCMILCLIILVEILLVKDW